VEGEQCQTSHRDLGRTQIETIVFPRRVVIAFEGVVFIIQHVVQTSPLSGPRDTNACHASRSRVFPKKAIAQSFGV
jgi:hypothetical protein